MNQHNQRACTNRQKCKGTLFHDFVIGTNDKFQFIASLFGGDEKAFEQAIKTINGFKIYAEAQFWIKSNLREQNKWEETDDVVKAFDLLVKRRFA